MEANRLQNAAINLIDKSMAVMGIIFAMKTIEDYGRNLRGAVRGLWNGTFDVGAFTFQVAQALERAFEQAWAEGARSQGIEPDERTSEEQKKLDKMISEQSGFIPGLADFVQAHLKADGFKLSEAQSRVPMWTNRYRDVRTTAELMSGENFKEVWTLGPTDHCPSCLKLAGKVKRKNQWLAAGIQPRVAELACRGFNCLCELLRTDAPLSKGPLPGLP